MTGETVLGNGADDDTYKNDSDASLKSNYGGMKRQRISSSENETSKSTDETIKSMNMTYNSQQDYDSPKMLE